MGHYHDLTLAAQEAAVGEGERLFGREEAVVAGVEGEFHRPRSNCLCSTNLKTRHSNLRHKLKRMIKKSSKINSQPGLLNSKNREPILLI